MKFAHAPDDRLAGVLVGPDLEGRILLLEGEQGLAQLVLVGLGLGFDGHRDDGLGKLHPLEDDRPVGVGQRVAGGGELQSDGGHDVTGEDGLLVFPVVGVHLEDATHPLLAVLRRVRHGAAGRERPRVDPEVGELAHVGVAHDLEGEGGERLGVVGPANGLAVAGDQPLNRRDVHRRGQVGHDGVEQRLDGLVLEG